MSTTRYEPKTEREYGRIFRLIRKRLEKLKHEERIFFTRDYFPELTPDEFRHAVKDMIVTGEIRRLRTGDRRKRAMFATVALRPAEHTGRAFTRNKCKGCGYPCEGDSCGECLCEEDGL